MVGIQNEVFQTISKEYEFVALDDVKINDNFHNFWVGCRNCEINLSENN